MTLAGTAQPAYRGKQWFFTTPSVYFLMKSSVWVHLATVDSLDPGQLEKRQCESVTQKRPSENIFHWLYSGNQDKQSTVQSKHKTLREGKGRFQLQTSSFSGLSSAIR